MVAPSRSHLGDGPPHAASLLPSRPPAREVSVDNLDRRIETGVRAPRPQLMESPSSPHDDPPGLLVGDEPAFLKSAKQLEDHRPGRDGKCTDRHGPACGGSLRHDRSPAERKSAADPRGTNRRPLPRRRGRGVRDAANMNSFTISAATDAPLGDCPAAIVPAVAATPLHRRPRGAGNFFARRTKPASSAARDDALNFRNLRRDERALHAHRYGGVDVQEVGPGVQAHGI